MSEKERVRATTQQQQKARVFVRTSFAVDRLLFLCVCVAAAFGGRKIQFSTG